MDFVEFLVGDFEDEELQGKMPRLIKRKYFCGCLLIFCLWCLVLGTWFLYLLAEPIYRESVLENYRDSQFARASPEVLALSSPWYNQPTDPKSCDGAFEDSSMRTREGGFSLVSSQNGPMINVPCKLKKLATKESQHPLNLRLPHNHNGEFSTMVPPQYDIWFNLTYYPWFGLPMCTHFSTKFSEKRLPVVALVSFPSSGNSWLRFLVEGATGIFSGSVYKDTRMSSVGYYGEMLPHNSGRTVVVKSHGLRADMFDRCHGKAILLIRNPYKALKSFLNHKSGGKHDGHARTLDDGQDGPWNVFVKKRLAYWESVNTDWVTRSGDAKGCEFFHDYSSKIHVVQFEDVVDTDKRPEVMRSILNYLEFPVNEKRIKCINKHGDGKLQRQGCADDIKQILDIFTPEQKVMVDAAIDRLRDKMQEYIPDQAKRINLDQYKSTVVNFC